LRASALISIATLAPAAALAQAEDVGEVELLFAAVAGNVYMLEGSDGAGNLAVCIGVDGAVLVDAQFAARSGAIRAALAELDERPVRFVINTHYHADHSGGNVAFQPEAWVIAHHQVRDRLEKGGFGGNFGTNRYEFAPSSGAALPMVTFESELTLHLNGEAIRILHFPNSHTAGDSVVFFSRANVVHMGDLFVTYGFPSIDLVAGGSVRGMVATLETLLRELPSDARVIPGHGPVSSLDDVRRFAEMLQQTAAVVQRGIAQGKSLSQLQAERVLEPWSEFAGYFTAEQFTETLYNDATFGSPELASSPGKSVANGCQLHAPLQAASPVMWALLLASLLHRRRGRSALAEHASAATL
jgi:cyclase